MLVKGFIKDGYLKKNWKALVMTLISIAMIPASVLIIAEYNMKKKPWSVMNPSIERRIKWLPAIHH